jgi:hypothetical protein
LGWGALLPLPVPATMAITAMTAPAPTKAKPVRGSWAARTPADRPGLRGPACWAGLAAEPASAAWAKGAPHAKTLPISKAAKMRIPSVFLF